DLNEASMRYLSDGRLGNNSGLLQNVKVTLLQGQNYRAGPVVPGTQLADAAGQTRVVTPATQAPPTQVAQGATPSNVAPTPASARTPTTQSRGSDLSGRARDAVDNVRQGMVDAGQGGRIAQDVFEEPGARGDRLIAERTAALRERALTAVGRGT